jgi:hypothetical protein
MNDKIKFYFSSLGCLGKMLAYVVYMIVILSLFFWALTLLAAIGTVLGTVSLLVLVPLLLASLFKRARVFCGNGIVYASIVLGISTLLTATVYLNEIWGKTVVVIGCMMGGIWLVPLAVLALSIRGQFAMMFMILGQLATVFIMMFLGMWIESKGNHIASAHPDETGDVD